MYLFLAVFWRADTFRQQLMNNTNINIINLNNDDDNNGLVPGHIAGFAKHNNMFIHVYTYTCIL